MLFWSIGLSFLNSRSALLNAVFLEAIVCSASAGSDPPLTSRAIMRLCSTKLDGTRKSPGTGIVLAAGADAVHVLEVCGRDVGIVEVELWRFSHSAVAVIGLVWNSLSRS